MTLRGTLVGCGFFAANLVEVDGSAGSIRLGLDYRMDVTADGRLETENVDSALRPWMEKPWHVVQGSVFNIQKHWVDCLTKGMQPTTSGADNLLTLRLGLAGYESAESGKCMHFTK